MVASVEGGTVRFTLDDEGQLERIDRTIAKWHPNEVGNVLGMDLESVDVVRE